MDNLTALQDINFFEWFIILVAIVLAGQFLYKTFVEGIVEKFGIETKRMKQRREDHELLVKTSQNLVALQEQHNKDESHLEESLLEFINESRKENNELRNEMYKYTDNRIHDREQSLEIQRELTDSIKELTMLQKDRDVQIEALMVGSKELLGSTIDQLYSKYIDLGGVPENEIDEFESVYGAYAQLNGNGTRKAKFNYVKENLPIIPVEVKLLKD